MQLLREQQIISQEQPPQEAQALSMWRRYAALFADARELAPALAGEVAKGPFPDALAREIVSLLDERESCARALAALSRGEDLFGPFTGRWHGTWTQDGASEEYEHDWQPTIRLGCEDPLDIQQVHMRAASGAETLAINALNLRSGRITGGVGLGSGDLCRRPHAGFYLSAGALLWIALESDHQPGAQRSTYSFFHEVARKGEYTVLGLGFTWDRHKRTLHNLTQKGGHYVLC